LFKQQVVLELGQVSLTLDGGQSEEVLGVLVLVGPRSGFYMGD
jgi:hypothetical protein